VCNGGPSPGAPAGPSGGQSPGGPAAPAGGPSSGASALPSAGGPSAPAAPSFTAPTPPAAAPPGGGQQPSAPTQTGPETGASSDIEGARLVLLNLALSGSTRDEADRYVAEHFNVPDRKALLDEVFATAGE